MTDLCTLYQSLVHLATPSGGDLFFSGIAKIGVLEGPGAWGCGARLQNLGRHGRTKNWKSAAWRVSQEVAKACHFEKGSKSCLFRVDTQK